MRISRGSYVKRGFLLLLVAALIIGMFPGAALARAEVPADLDVSGAEASAAVQAAEPLAVDTVGAVMAVPFSAPLVSVSTEAALRQAVLDAAGGSVFIQLTADITMTGNAIVIPAGTSVYLGSALFNDAFSIYQHTSASSGMMRRHFVVEGGTLSLGYVHLTRDFPTTDMRRSGGVYVFDGGTLNMFEGSAISNNRSDVALVTVVHETSVRYAGGVFIRDVGSTFNMVAGEIYGNHSTRGGGVTVRDGSEFNMSGTAVIRDHNTNGVGAAVLVDAEFSMSGNARIFGNTSNSLGGGVRVRVDGTFNMSENAQIYNNHATSGGGVAVWQGSFIQTGGTIGGDTPAHANTAVHGGGVFLESGATFTMDGADAVIRGNVANGGGGVRVTDQNSSFQLVDGTIEWNLATGSGNSPAGGGVDVNSEATFTMTDGRIRNNTVDTSGGGVRAINNARIYIHGGEIYGNESQGGTGGGGIRVLNNSHVTMTGGVIRDNTARNGGGGLAVGTAAEYGSSFTMTDGIIENNTATNGGGVFVHGANSVFTMTGGTIGGDTPAHANTATQGGGVWVGNGATFTMDGADALIRGNTATVSGGGVLLYNATFEMPTGTIINNTSHGAANTDGGGGVFAMGEFTMSGTALIEGNTAVRGGGVRISENSEFIMRGGRIYNNTASLNGGGLRLNAGSETTIIAGEITDNRSGNGAGIYAFQCTLTMTGGQIRDNIATSSGGGVQLSNGATFTMDGADAVIRGNVATEPTRSWNHGGGGVLVRGMGSEFILSAGTIESNEAVIGGGGVLVGDSASFEMFGGVIRNNNAVVRGGGVYVSNPSTNTTPATFIMHDGSISGNKHTGEDLGGGGIRVAQNATFTMHDGLIENNISNRHSGGLSIANTASATIYDGIIRNNIAGTDGGGVTLNSGGTFLTMYGGIIYNNTAIRGGGVAAFANATFDMSGGNIEDNDAGTYGGGVWLGADDATMIATGGSIINNHAERDGGGIFTVDHDYNRILSTGAYGNLTIAPAVVFSGNTAGNGSFTPPENWNITAIQRGASPLSPATAAHRVHQLNNYDVNFRYGVELTIAKSASETEVQAGDVFSYTLTVTNPSDTQAIPAGRIVGDDLDLDLVEWVGNVRGTLNGNPITLFHNSAVGGNLRVTLPAIPAEAVITISFDVRATDEAAEEGEVYNTAFIVGEGDDDNTYSNEVRVDVDERDPDPVVPAPTIAKSASASEVQAGDVFSYTLTVTNPSEDVAIPAGRVVGDDLDLGLVEWVGNVRGTLNGATITLFSSINAAGEVRVTLPALPAEGVITITFDVRATDEAAEEGEVRNTAFILGEGDDDDIPSNEVIVDVDPRDPDPVVPDPTIGKSANPTSVQAGDTITYMLTVTNPSGTLAIPAGRVVGDDLDLELVEWVGNVRGTLNGAAITLFHSVMWLVSSV